jgi:hypothetical protein
MSRANGDRSASALTDAEAQKRVRALIEELIRASFALQDVLASLLEELPEGTFPGEQTVDVLIEMIVGSCLPAVDAVGLSACADATALLADVRNRVLEDLRIAAETRRSEECEGA